MILLHLEGIGNAMSEESSSKDVGLTCGTLVIIALIVAFLGNQTPEELPKIQSQVGKVQGDLKDVDKRLSKTQKDLDEVQKALDASERQRRRDHKELKALLRAQGEEQVEGRDPNATQAAWRVILDLPALAPYWHQDLPERLPIHAVTGGDLPAPQVAIEKFGAPVVFQTPVQALSEVKPRPVLLITHAEWTGGALSVGFTYGVEGVVGSLKIVQTAEGWVAQDVRVAER